MQKEQERVARKEKTGCFEVTSEPMLRPTELFSELTNGSLKRIENEKIVRLVTATAGKEAISIFRESLHRIRQQAISTIPNAKPSLGNSPSLRQIVTTLRNLKAADAYSSLTRRFHLVKLVEHLERKDNNFIEVNEYGRGHMRTRRGNPVNNARADTKDAAITQALHEAYSDTIGAKPPVTALEQEKLDRTWDELKQKLKRDYTLGRHWKMLKDEYGFGVLPLIPAVKESPHYISDSM